MERHQSEIEELRIRVETKLDELHPTDEVELRIIKGLQKGVFHERISAKDLADILFHIVYTTFAQKTVVGFDVGIVPNVVKMDVVIADNCINVEFIVHVHKPVIAFLDFSYTLINGEADEGEAPTTIVLVEDSLHTQEKTRRFDLKAKAALVAMNVHRIAKQEMSDMAGIMKKTFPPQMEGRGYNGRLDTVHLRIEDDALCVYLEGEAHPLAGDKIISPA